MAKIVKVWIDVNNWINDHTIDCQLFGFLSFFYMHLLFNLI